MLKFYLTYCLLFLVSFVCGQNQRTFNVSGVVLSASSGEPIPEAIIMVTRSSGYKSDSMGRFVLYNLSPGQHRISFSAFGYDSRDTIITVSDSNIPNIRWTISTSCLIYNRDRALRDINAHSRTILLQSGITPVVYQSDKEFERKYSVVYYDFGCVAPDKLECLVVYNKAVFEDLDRVYGKGWRKEIRKDAIGLKLR